MCRDMTDMSRSRVFFRGIWQWVSDASGETPSFPLEQEKFFEQALGDSIVIYLT